MKLNRKAVVVTGLAAVAAVGGTFAYYNSSLSMDNPLSTGHYNTQLVEDFTPPEKEWKPGATIDKQVGVTNTGDYPVLVRIKMDENWKRADKETPFKTVKTSDENMTEDLFAAMSGQEDKEYVTDTTRQADDSDGEVANDGGSVVRKNLSGSTDWKYNENDGYWYYYKVLYKGEASDNFMDSITLASNIDLGKYNETDYYYVGSSDTDVAEIDTDSWVKYVNDGSEITIYSVQEDKTVKEEKIGGDLNEDGSVDAIDLAQYLTKNGTLTADDKLFRKNESLLDESAKGYADANYTLTVTSEFVQATPEAVNEVFKTASDDFKALANTDQSPAEETSAASGN